MREAARALDDVSDHLGEVLRHADELLAEWSRFGAQVRTQVEREAAAVGEVIDGAVTRAASSGLDRAIADRLRALTTEIDRLEQRTRAASRAASEQREADRRVLWIVVAGIVLANALLVALLLRKPDAALVAEPVRIESTATPQPPPAGSMQEPAAGSTDLNGTANAGSAAGSSDATPGAGSSAANAGTNAGSNAAGAKSGSNAPNAGTNAGSNAAGAKSGSNATPNAGSNAAGTKSGSNATPNAGTNAGSNAAGAKSGSSAANAPAKSTPPGNTAKQPAEAAGPAIALPPKGGNLRTHKKLP